MRIASKWRPRLSLVVATVIAMVLMLPVASLLYFNFYGKQLVQQTEEALIGQAAVLAAQFAHQFKALDADPKLGPVLPKEARSDPDKRYHPLFPSLSLGKGAIVLERADPLPSLRPAMGLYQEIGRSLTAVSKAAQKTSLAGFRAIDPFGQVIGGSGEIGYTLGHIPEVQNALAGYPTTLLRKRVSDEPDPPVWSISRSTNFRVFVALPVIVDNHVIGAVYVSRTPGNIVQAMYLERANVARAGGFILAGACIIGFVFWRFITGPIYGLIAQADRASDPDPDPLRPLEHYGTQEVAKLGQSFISMTDTIHKRAKSTQTFTNHVTHELKSPLTSILGATELLTDPEANLSDAARAKFIENMAQDAERMTLLLDKLAKLAAAKDLGRQSSSDPAESMAEVTARFPQLTIRAEFDGKTIPMGRDNLTIVLTHLLENAAQHGASSVAINYAGGLLSVHDNGKGISPQNKSRVFDPFFTTRRDAGGTGMGLGIVEALVASSGGEITLAPSKTGAKFNMTWAGPSS